MTYIGAILISIGVIFSFLGTLGLMRMKDIYNRLQTSTKATTLGALSTILGVGFLNPMWLPKTIVIAFFILVTAPIASHALARSSHKTKAAMMEETQADAYAEYENSKQGGEE